MLSLPFYLLLASGALDLLDAAASSASEGELAHHTLEEALVDRLQRGERVAGELDGAAEARELAGALVDGDVVALLQHGQRRGEPAHAATFGAGIMIDIIMSTIIIIIIIIIIVMYIYIYI